MSSESTNSYAWACRTNGTVSAAQRRALKAAIRRGYLNIGKSLISWPLHRSKVTASLPGPPDSKLARRAEEAATDQSPALAGHGYRTWLIGAALSQHDRMPVDPELFYVASLLHDSGMMREVVGEDFTIRSARIIVDVCGRVETLDEGVGMRLADAVVAHASPGLTPRDDAIGFYVQSGAMADLAGLRMWDLPRGYLRAAYNEHPACDVHRAVPELIRRESRDVPEGRFALLCSAGMDRMVQFSPTRRYASRGYVDARAAKTA